MRPTDSGYVQKATWPQSHNYARAAPTQCFILGGKTLDKWLCTPYTRYPCFRERHFKRCLRASHPQDFHPLSSAGSPSLGGHGQTEGYAGSSRDSAKIDGASEDDLIFPRNNRYYPVS
jgi:hypothetical protein